MIREYVKESLCDADTKRYLEDVITFISMKASGNSKHVWYS